MKIFSTAILLYLTLALLLAEPSRANNPAAGTRMDVFMTAEPASKEIDAFVMQHPEISLRVFTLDAIENLEDELSEALPADPREAKRLALARLTRLSKDTRAKLEHSATAIATALHLGIKKYPAIVFNSEFVVYGVTDPFRALEHYRRWHLAAAA